jgi:hypothetical protein
MGAGCSGPEAPGKKNMKLLSVTIACLLLAVAIPGSAQCLKVDKGLLAHHAMKPGETINVKLRLITSHCNLAHGTNDAIDRIFIAPEPGFESKKSPTIYSDFPTTEHNYASGEQQIETEVELRADTGAIAGEHKILVFVNYKVEDEQGKISDKGLSFFIAVRVDPLVVGRSYKQRHPRVNEALHRTGRILLGIVGIVLFPLVYGIEILGGVTC